MNGQTLSHYEILDKLDEGGMGVVYRARDTRLGRSLAIKVLRPESLADADRRRRFEQEARAASALNHSGIVTIYEIDQAVSEQGTVDFIAMELVEGTPLSRLIPEGGLPVDKAVDYAVQMAEALAAAHDAGIVHRDVKPGNVMVTPAGRVKVLDFGLAKLTEPERPVQTADDVSPTLTASPGTQHGVIVGTVAYMSPEQADGKPVDARSDVFSLGTVIYEMLGGRRPFHGDSALKTLAAILHDSPPPLRVLRPDVPAELDRIVARCLRKDRGERFTSAGEARAELAALQSRLASGRVTLRSVLARPRHAAALGLSLALLAGVAGWAWMRGSRARWAREVALPEISRLAALEETVAAWRLARRAQEHLPDDVALERLWDEFSFPYTIRSDPPGAAVYFKDYLKPSAPWEFAGRAPLERVRLPSAYLRFKAEKDGFETVDQAEHERLGQDGALIEFTLVPSGEAPPGMVRVPAGESRFPGAPPLAVPSFWIDTYEVTNRQYKEFVDGGGYERRELWSEPFLDDGRTLGFEDAVARFRDRTGRTGPATWELGTYPDGQGDLPVGGVSWYEATAYAAFAGKSLPTVHHWRQAAQIGVFSEVVMLSNFAGKGPAAVGRHQGVGAYGTYDMAGNVKEWCLNAAGGRRYVLGGAWNEPAYIYGALDVEPPFARAPTYGVRCVKATEPMAPELAGEIAVKIRDYSKERPASDEAFALYRSLYSYDRGPLEAKVVAVEDGEHWRAETVGFTTGYGDERMTATLYLPRNAAPPYQVVVYFPGSDAEQLRNGQHLSLHWFDFLVRSGRAVMFPVYEGMYDRIVPGPWSPNKRRDLVIAWSKDLGRTIDYLETRSDVDRERLAYYGFSLGGTYAPVLVSMEPRIKAVLLVGAGLPSVALPPEIDPINFAPRTRVPVLMLNGREDFDSPLEEQQLPFLRFLGTSEKKHVLFEGGHLPPTMHGIIAESLAWLDRHLGPVKKAPAGS